MQTTHRTVVVSPNWLGDAVMALPALAAVRSARPEDPIIVAGRASTAPLFSMVDGVNEVVRLDSRGGLMGAASWAEDAATLRAIRADTAILFPNSFRSAWAVRRAGIPERWGYSADLRSILLTRRVPRPRGRRHQAEYYTTLVEALGFPVQPLPPLPRIKPPVEAQERAAALLARHGLEPHAQLVGLAPGAAYGKAKQWPPDRYAQLAVELRRRIGVTSLVFGARADRPTGAEIERCLPGGGVSPIVNLIGQTDLPLLVALMTRCGAFVSNDSGAMHVAAAAGLPVSAVFGASDERGTAPLPSDPPGPAPHVILSSPAWCRPCMLRECPIDHRCMTRIDAARVAEAVEGQLRAGKDSGIGIRDSGNVESRADQL